MFLQVLWQLDMSCFVKCLSAIHIPLNKHRRADGGPPPQISLAIQEVLPHPSGLTGGGVPYTLCRRWQALQRRVQCKLWGVCAMWIAQCMDICPASAEHVQRVVIKCYASGLRTCGSMFISWGYGSFFISRCRVTTTSGPLRRRAESTTERKTDTPTFYHVSEVLSSAACNIIVTFRLGVVLITYSKGKVMLAFFLLFSADDHSRVVLSHLDGHLCSDYINASYIDVNLSHRSSFNANNWALGALSVTLFFSHTGF